ncbi:unnamed protein product [Microthlaspi erraticum]|uniref:X8 domain-containing protein n=1 Tax=Microthlaspi erraticum TaxID=1685480 RepID=A0A6D2KGE8_9BRAS|nr:unnamed protein product [Microthlaspi erraticum]
MAKMSPFFTPSFLLLVSVVILQLSAVISAVRINSRTLANLPQQQKNLDAPSSYPRWCVPKQETTDAQLQANIDFVCKINKMDCRSIFPGPERQCSQDTLTIKAAYAMTSYYISKGLTGDACSFNGSGIVTTDDPPASYTCAIPQGIPDAKWCVAKQETTDTQLQANIDLVCKIHGIDCTSIFPGPDGLCSNSTLRTRAEFAMTAYYISNGLLDLGCNFNGSGIVTPNPPASNTCGRPDRIVDAKWCVPKQGTTSTQLQANIDSVCNTHYIDCKGPDGSCSKDTLETRAAYAMTANYISNGLNEFGCYFNGTAIITTTSPSSNTCFIPGGL